MKGKRRKMRNRGVLSAVLALLIFFLPYRVEGITGAEVIEKVQEKLEEHKTFSARFEKQFYWAILDKKRSRQGKIYMHRPARFRVEVEDGDLVVADGQAIWAYVKKNFQVVVSPYSGELKTPWEVLFDYAENYAPIAIEEVKLDGRSSYLISLKPEIANSRIAQMKIWVDRKRWFLLKVEQLEANDNVTTYILKDHKTNKKLDDTLFQFTPPEGVEVIDRRDSGLEE